MGAVLRGKDGIPWADLLVRAKRQGIRPRVRLYPQGSLIFAQGDPSPYLFGVLEGIVKLVHLLPEGRSLTLRLLGSGDLFGKSALIGGPRQAYAEAVHDVRLVLWQPKELVRVAAEHPEALLALMKAQAQEAYEMQTRLLVAVFGGLQDELAVLLWFLGRRFGRETPGGLQLEPKLPVRVLADLLGHSRQRVNEALLTFQAQGWIDRHYGRIVITDLEGLRKRAQPFLELAGGG